VIKGSGHLGQVEAVRPRRFLSVHVTTFDGVAGGWFNPSALEVIDPPAKQATLVQESPSQARKNKPVVRGALDYFPAALLAVAELSRLGNEKHNPGEEMHHARGKSSDHADCLVRHLMERGTVDPESGLSHTVAVAWRALALLQEELEAAGAPKARGAR